MRIHKGETQGQPQQPPFMSRPRFPGPQMHPNNQLNYRQPPPMPPQYPTQPMMEAMIKQEPMDMATMEPMVEIHEQEQQGSFPATLGEGAVSITPISKNPKQRPMINANVMKIVQSNPNLSIKKSPEKLQPVTATTSQGPMPMGVALPDPDRYVNLTKFQ